MRLTTRIGLGYFLVAGLLIGTLAYQLSVVERLQRINEQVSLTNLEAARISVWLLEGIEGIREFAAKSTVLGDADYHQQWEEWEEVMDADLRQLEGIGLDGEEEEARRRIGEGWALYLQSAEDLREDPMALLELELVLNDLRDRVEDLIRANEAAVAAQAALTSEAGARAHSVARTSAGIALLLVTLASFLLYRSISGPLRRLTRGTREVARGRFDHRLEVSGPAELRSLARDFNSMAERLYELEGLKRDFVSHVSHELKTPLAAIQETVEIFLEEIPGPLSAKQRRLMELSRSSAQRLSAMISDLLEASRLEAGASTYHPAKHDIAEIARSVLEEVEPLARERGLRVSMDEGEGSTVAICDGERIRDVLMNVITNAVKFSPREGAVQLGLMDLEQLPPTIPAHAQQGVKTEVPPFLLFSIEDDGPGVPDGEKERIFEKFHQAGRKARLRGEGVGLGLAIAQRLVQAHRGAIWVEDRPVGGSVFRILIPRVPSHWRDVVAEEDSGPPKREERRLVRTGPKVAGTVPFLVVALAASGCLPLPRSPAPPEPAPPPPAPAAVEAPARPIDTVPLPAPPTSILDEAHALMVEERFGEAAERLREVLVAGAPFELLAEALWGLALVYIHPRSPIREPALAQHFLAALNEDFADTVAGLQAEWVTGMMGELAAAELRLQEQEELLRSLNDVLEVLRGIDLQRQPGRAPRPDTVPAPPPPGP